MITPSPIKRTLFFLFFDIALSLFTLFLAYNLRFNFHIDQRYLHNFFTVFLVLTFLKISAIAYFKIYRVSWRFVSLHEAKKLVYAHLLAYALFVGCYYIFPEPFTPFPRSVLMIDLFLSILVIGLLRVAKRLFVERGQKIDQLPKTMLIGVSALSQTILREKKEFCIAAIVDDSSMVIDSFLMNYKVHGFQEIEALVDREKIVSVIIGKKFDRETLQKIYQRLNQKGVYDIKVLTLENEKQKLKKITVKDLLARHPKDLDTEMIASFIRNKKVLITGAGGSIGSEIARQCQKFGAASLTLIDSSEFNLYQIGEQIREADLRLLNVTDLEGLQRVFSEAKPDIVIHAAAYKHVPICERNQEIAVRNNVLGTKNVIDCSILHKVQKVVVISTDKAVRPTNVMGATKRVTELYAQNVPSGETEIVAVRFGNVLGSSGSVIPKFKAQIEEGGPVTVTHPEITRYFMLISEACQLVLQAAAIAKGGELFILDMGEPVKIADLAKQMIRLYDKEGEVEIVYTGLRPGEKLYEELLIDESEQKTKYSSIFIARPTKYDIEQLCADIEALLDAEDKVEALQKIVPEFTREDLL